jgi:ABC-type branched-subunit amino acid transport system ATPase component
MSANGNHTLLQARDVTHYFGGLCAVSQFNLDLLAGVWYHIPNGAGNKPSLIDHRWVLRISVASLLHLAWPDGMELVGKTPNQDRLACAHLRTIRLFRDMTVLDNVRTAHIPERLQCLKRCSTPKRYAAGERQPETRWSYSQCSGSKALLTSWLKPPTWLAGWPLRSPRANQAHVAVADEPAAAESWRSPN